MKKLLFFAVLIGGIAFTSCSKKACECTTNGVTTTTDDVEEDECDEASDLLEAFNAGSCKSV